MSASSVSSSDSSVGCKLEHYGDASFLDEQIRLIDLVPRRLTTFILWLAAALSIIAGLEVLHTWQSKLPATNLGGHFAAFDLTRSGCLSSWFSSLLLLAASVAAWLVYTIRRHRTDDYHGRYRIWIWAALCWFFAATDVAANLHESFKQIMIRLTQTYIWGDGTLWWIIPYALAFGALGSRLVLDMRPCRLSIATFLFATAGYLLAASMELGLLTADDAARAVMIKAGAAMFGNSMLLLSAALNARYVILDAEGLLPRREPKLSVKSIEDTTEKISGAASSEWMRVDSRVGTPQPVLRRATSPAASSSPAIQPTFSSSSAPPAPVTCKLTKQEKKALRERLMRERLERQRRSQ